MNLISFLRALLFSHLRLSIDDEGGGAPAPDYGNDFAPDGDDAAAPEAAPEPTKAEPEAAPEAAKAEPEAAKAEQEPAEGEKHSPMIPKARFDEVLAKNRELQAQLQTRAAQQEQAQSTVGLQELEAKLDGLQEKYEAALMDGDVEQAKQLRTDIKAAQQQYNTAFAQQTQAATIAQLQAKAAWDGTLAKVEAEHPALNEDSDQYDPALAEEVVALMRDFQVSRQLPAHEALMKAVGLLAGEPAAKAPPVPAKTPEQVAKEEAAARVAAAEAKAAERKGSAVAKNVAAANATPPALHDTGKDGDAAGLFNGARVSEMGEREFEALRKNERALAVARGDIL